MRYFSGHGPTGQLDRRCLALALGALPKSEVISIGSWLSGAFSSEESGTKAGSRQGAPLRGKGTRDSSAPLTAQGPSVRKRWSLACWHNLHRCSNSVTFYMDGSAFMRTPLRLRGGVLIHAPTASLPKQSVPQDTRFVRHGQRLRVFRVRGEDEPLSLLPEFAIRQCSCHHFEEGFCCTYPTQSSFAASTPPPPPYFVRRTAGDRWWKTGRQISQLPWPLPRLSSPTLSARHSPTSSQLPRASGTASLA